MHHASAQGLIDYIWQSPSPFHAVETSAQMLRQAGFVEIKEKLGDWEGQLEPGTGGFIIRGASLVAWRSGTEAPAQGGFRLLGAHTDSPNLRIKPNPDVGKDGYRQVGVEPYGGLILATWTDRDLGLSGKVVVRDDTGLNTRLFRTDAPVARIANVAIHLNREVNTKGLKLDRQKHMVPLLGLGKWDGLAPWLAEQMGVHEVLTWELGLHDVQPPSLGGIDREFVFAPRLDNLGSCYPAVVALCSAQPSPRTQVVALFDHEEVGSRSYRGAAGPLLQQVLRRLERNHPQKAHGGLERAVANSWMMSADMAHGLHPNFADKNEPDHRPRLNGGPVLKANVSQRYATDCESAALFKSACADLGLPCQDFVTRSDLACGTTIGPISAAQLGIRTVDVGCAMLSMHSVREQCGSDDPAMMARLMQHVLET